MALLVGRYTPAVWIDGSNPNVGNYPPSVSFIDIIDSDDRDAAIAAATKYSWEKTGTFFTLEVEVKEVTT